MASIIWLDSDGNRHESEKFSNIKFFRSYINGNHYNIKVVELLDCKGLISLCDDYTLRGLFEDCKNLIKVEKVINTLQVKNMFCMFLGCSSLESVPYFDTLNVRNMDFMFSKCGNLKSVPLLDISMVEDMDGMFENCNKLRSYTLPCDEYNTRSSVLKSYNDYKKSRKLLKELKKLWRV